MIKQDPAAELSAARQPTPPLPPHWRLMKLKRLLRAKKGAIKTGPFGSQLQSWEMVSGNIKVFNQENVIDSDLTIGDNYITEEKFRDLRAFEVFPGDLLVTTRGTIGRCVTVPESCERGILHPCLMRIQVDERRVLNRYLQRVIQDGGWVLQQLKLLSNATTIDVVYSESLKNVWIPVPPLDEQRVIVDYIDRVATQVDALIKNYRRLLDVRKEQLTTAVLSASQLANTREMRLGSVAEIVERSVIQKPGELYMPIGLYNRARGLFHKEKRGMDDMGDSDFFWVLEGDLVISGQFAWEGAIGMAQIEDSECVASHRYYIVRGRKSIALTEYLYALLATPFGNFLLGENSRGAAGRNRPLNIRSLLKERIPVPELQIQIGIREEVRRNHQLVKAISKQLQNLEEYRSAVISAATSGQMDTRRYGTLEAAAACQ